jgi:hypothetical protein
MHARERRKGRGRLCCVLLEDTIFARVLTTIECPAGGVGKGGDANAPPLSVMFANVEGRSEFKRFSGLGNSEPKHGKEVRAKLVIAARCPPHTHRHTNARAHTHTHTHTHTTHRILTIHRTSVGTRGRVALGGETLPGLEGRAGRTVWTKVTMFINSVTKRRTTSLRLLLAPICSIRIALPLFV